ncbi:MAG: hypothetical protein DWQ04_11755 [Chloroflexi bacterium]|nr:MAG: hypothetical protein DWQ04_11755 [Chloroflexota bacterium]
MKTTELIERYVYEVGQHLPRKMQGDIQLELSSLLHDALDERAAETGKEPNTEMAAALLREFGKPESMAANYRPERYLIGPTLYPTFIVVIKIVSIVLASLYGLLFGLSLISGSEASIFLLIWNFLVDLGGTLLLNGGIIIAIFATIEYFSDGSNADGTEDSPDWDPMELPKVSDPSRIKRGELIWGIVWSIFFIVLFTVFPDKISYFSSLNEGDQTFLPLLAAEFFVHVPWLVASWTLDIFLKVLVLREGRWTAVFRWLELVFDLFGFYVLYRIVIGGPIANLDILTWLIKGVLGIVMIVMVFAMVGQLYQLVLKRPFSPTESFKSRIA